MGLDVYVGTLTRYCAGDWQTSTVTAALAQGVDVKIARHKSDGTVDLVDARDIPPASPEHTSRVRGEVERWRRDVAQALSSSNARATSMDWQETPDLPYFTAKPDWYGFGAMLLLAAYEEEKPVFGAKAWYPKTFDFERWQQDPVLDAAFRSRKSRYSQLVGPEAWLPGGTDPPLMASLPLRKKKIAFGAIDKALAQIQELNARTYRGTANDLGEWRNDDRVGEDDPTHPFEPNAKFGMAIFLDLARKAVEHRLPIVLDY